MTVVVQPSAKQFAAEVARAAAAIPGKAGYLELYHELQGVPQVP